MDTSDFTITTDDAETIVGYRWSGPGEPKAIVQIAHGMGEHAARYARLAEALTAAGFAVYASDHRGHGSTASAADHGYFADHDGWDTVVAVELADRGQHTLGEVGVDRVHRLRPVERDQQDPTSSFGEHGGVLGHGGDVMRPPRRSTQPA